MATEYLLIPTNDDIFEPIIIDPIAAASINSGGNGITGNIAPAYLFNIFNEGSNNQSIANLLLPTHRDFFIPDNLMGSKWGVAIGQGANLTYSFPTIDSVYSYTNADVENRAAFSTAQITAAHSAMGAWSAVANLTFTERSESPTSAGDIRWSNTIGSTLTTTARGYPAVTSVISGDIWVDPEASVFSLELQPGQYGHQTMIHELGHVLGLAHPHQTLFAPLPGEDQLRYSTMSYRSFDGARVDFYNIIPDFFFPTTPMLNDIAAVQFLYGANTSYHMGNNTYSWAATAHVYETIWDAGGTDTISAANQAQAVTINLNSGQWSTIGVSFTNGSLNPDETPIYVNDGLTIAYGATIENATGSAYADTLIGNLVNNLLNGGTGNDILQGGAGNDTLQGGAGNDNLQGGVGDDILQGGGGNDVLVGSAGKDTYNGGLGNDTFRLKGNALIDTIQDFSSANDTIQLENAIFTSLINTGVLSANVFRAGAGFTSAAAGATGANDFIIYDTSTGGLYYDAGGNTGAAAVEIALLATHPAITNADFVIV